MGKALKISCYIYHLNPNYMWLYGEKEYKLAKSTNPWLPSYNRLSFKLLGDDIRVVDYNFSSNHIKFYYFSYRY